MVLITFFMYHASNKIGEKTKLERKIIVSVLMSSFWQGMSSGIFVVS